MKRGRFIFVCVCFDFKKSDSSAVPPEIKRELVPNVRSTEQEKLSRRRACRPLNLEFRHRSVLLSSQTHRYTTHNTTHIVTVITMSRSTPSVKTPKSECSSAGVSVAGNTVHFVAESVSVAARNVTRWLLTQEEPSWEEPSWAS